MRRIVVVTAAVAAFGCGLRSSTKAQFEISASHIRYEALSRSWELSVNGPGEAELKLWKNMKTPRRYRVPPAELTRVRGTVERERFFELRDSYGVMAVDGPRRKMAVRLGEREKTVSIYWLPPDARRSPAELAELQRALRVWGAIRGLFDVPDAVDAREEDKRFLPDAGSTADDRDGTARTRPGCSTGG